MNLTKRDIEIFNFQNLLRQRRRVLLNRAVGSGGGGSEPVRYQDGNTVKYQNNQTVFYQT